ncbi:MAG: pyridoxal-dependent decarboxylase, exosortase A system-associated [Sphingomonadales bacterium]
MNQRPTPPPHAPVLAFGRRDGVLTIGGRDVRELVAQVGGTPAFFYERAFIEARVAALRAAMPAGIKLHYAIKANPMPAVLKLMAGLVDGLDVASAGELAMALDTGVNPQTISFAGPGKTDAELQAAIVAGIVLNLESAGEMRRAAAIAQRLGARPKVAVRVNPDFELKASGMHMGGGPRPFGVDAEQVPALLEEMSSTCLQFHGFHIFSGSQNLRVEAIMECQEKTMALALALARHAPEAPRMLNIGGGFGLPYFPGDRHLDLAPIGRNLDAVLAQARPQLPVDCEVILELGRYLVGEAGVYICQVVDRKISRGQVFLVTDGGLHHQLAASGNFGQVLRKNYPTAIATRIDQPETEKVNIVGCLCTPLDRLAEHVAMPAAQEGDLVAVFLAGAYGLSASPTAFLGHPPPAELLV